MYTTDCQCSLPTATNISSHEDEDDDISVHPNPAQTIVTVFTNAENEKTISLYNIEGRTLFTKITVERDIAIHTEKLPAGIYYIIINSKNKSTTKKISIYK